MRLSDFKVLTFDTYGTLIDWETGIWNALQPLLSAGGLAMAREDALNLFGRFETDRAVHGRIDRHHDGAEKQHVHLSTADNRAIAHIHFAHIAVFHLLTVHHQTRFIHFHSTFSMYMRCND